MWRIELLVSGIAMFEEPGWRNCDRSRLRGELMAGPGQLAVVPEARK